MQNLFAAFALLSACSAAPRSAPAGPAPAPAPTPTSTISPPLLQRLVAGETPGSYAHRWGTRFYELRTVRAGASGNALEARLHDETHFQGVGMRPDQMPPTGHTCSTWHPVPAAIRVAPGATSCTEARDACAVIATVLGDEPGAPCE